MVEKLEGVLGFSTSHVGPSLEGVWLGVVVLVLVDSGREVNLETEVFEGKSLRGAVVFVVDSDLKDKKHDRCDGYSHELFNINSNSCKLQKVGLRSTPSQSELLSASFKSEYTLLIIIMNL